MAWLRRRYGAGPLHLLSLVACVTLAGYVATRALSAPRGFQILVWFGLAALGHDLFLFPLYAVADRSLGWVARHQPGNLPHVPSVNYVRVPAVVSGMLVLVSGPLVLGLSEGSYRAATGLSTAPYRDRWLFITGALFAASATLYAVRVGRATVRSRNGSSAKTVTQ